MILVHGNMDLAPHVFSWDNFIRFMTDNLAGSNYLKTINFLRNDDFFTQHHAMQGLGLQSIKPENLEAGYASGAFMHAHNYMLTCAHISQETDYFTFGWSGLQSHRARLNDAKGLYNAVVQKIKEYKKEGHNPKIRIVGYSHGANVILNLGAWYNKDDECSIDEVVLLGLPVVTESDIHVASPFFKKIFNIYSTGDRVQPIDFLSVNRFFSGRIFKARKGLVLPKHLYQIRIGMKRIARTASNPCPLSYKNHSTPFNKSLIRKVDPSHVELWSFGWVDSYRSYFPLYPLPVGVYTTFLTDIVEQHEWLGNDITIDILPYCHTMRLWNNSTGQECIAPFLSEEHMKNLYELGKKFEPQQYNAQLFKKHVQQGFAYVRHNNSSKQLAASNSTDGAIDQNPSVALLT